jgi:hopanoid biosynthesis associated radical SAM protein HpnH
MFALANLVHQKVQLLQLDLFYHAMDIISGTIPGYSFSQPLTLCYNPRIMSLPLSMNLKVARYLAQARLSRVRPQIPLVLMLEITHACQLNCMGCGRIREYADTKSERLSRTHAREIILEAGTPVVSISGGETLLHPDVPTIVADALDLGKGVYLCTNGFLLAKRLSEFSPHPHFFFNVHIDGTPDFHDNLVQLPGVAERALDGIRQAKAAGFGVTTNTTIYRNTPVEMVVDLFSQLKALGVDGFMFAPAFAYEVGLSVETLTRAETRAWFSALRRSWSGENSHHSPFYFDFLCGDRELDCMPWGTVTYNPQGWKRPCYLLTDGHVSSFTELMDGTDWTAWGPGRDPRCANCMLHSGFEPSVVGNMNGPKDWLRIIRWQLGW